MAPGNLTLDLLAWEVIFFAIARYVLILFMLIYTFSCFTIFSSNDIHKQRRIFRRQRTMVFAFQMLGFLILLMHAFSIEMLLIFALLLAVFITCVILYPRLYPNASPLLINNMLMCINIGIITIARLNLGFAKRQLMFVVIGMVFALVVPVIIKHMKRLVDWRWIYAIVGLAALVFTRFAAEEFLGAHRAITIGGISVQPSEFVKILFVFFVAASLKLSTSLKSLIITSAVAGAHVIVLVLSTDLGTSVTLFITYVAMIYVASRKVLYAVAGLGAGAVASVVAFHLFNHVRVRVLAWRDPFAIYDTGGYQLGQSLFAIASGSWFGSGLFQGRPDFIPIVSEDFIFSAITEEMGTIVALCLILISISCFVMFLNISMEISEPFYKLIALGLGTTYIFQVFLTIGGAMGFIPSTGITLPLISYGGSSFLSTMAVFGIIQGLYIIGGDHPKRTPVTSASKRGGEIAFEEVGRTSKQKKPVQVKKTKFREL